MTFILTSLKVNLNGTVKILKFVCTDYIMPFFICSEYYQVPDWRLPRTEDRDRGM